MREFLENKVEVTQAEARALVERCLKVLYYRDARSYNRVRARHAHAPSRATHDISTLVRRKRNNYISLSAQ